MSIIKFELTEKHIALAKGINFIEFLESGIMDEESHVFGFNDIYEDVGLILYGIPEGDFDPLSGTGPEYTDEQKAEMDQLIHDMPNVLSVMVGTGNFEVGNYRTKFHDINWKKSKK